MMVLGGRKEKEGKEGEKEGWKMEPTVEILSYFNQLST